MSPRAAWRLERLGFTSVYDYAAGKMDWLSFGLPHEGHAVLVGDAADCDVATCDVDERVSDVAHRLGADDPVCVALNHAGVVMGVVDRDTADQHPDARIEDVMRFGITTVRPSEEVTVLVERMRDRNVGSIVVTRSDGTLVGVFTRAGHPGASLD